MRLSRLIIRSLIYYWRTNLAVLGGAAIAVAVLSGALLVGDSVRHSLRMLLYQRLGSTEHVVLADGFFREGLADALVSTGEADITGKSCPLIYLHGVVVHERTAMRAYDVNVYGVDERFWRFQELTNLKFPDGRAALVGDGLARKLAVRAGDALLMRVEGEHGIPGESLFGRRENAGRTVRLTCAEVLPAESLGEFSLRPSQGNVYSIFVPLELLQKSLAQHARANAILLAHGTRVDDLQSIRKLLRQKFDLLDAGVRLRPLPSGDSLTAESSHILLDDSIARAAFDAAEAAGMKASGVFAYLANSIRGGGREIPYSVIAAVDLGQGAMTSVRWIKEPHTVPAFAETREAIWLNEWAWRDLGISLGDSVELDYYLWQEEGHLETRTARFRLAGVVSSGGDIDTTLAPYIPGITAAKSIDSWDPPFPLDLRRIRPMDEEYWIRYKATPKAFITLARGQELWQSRFGRLSSVRMVPGDRETDDSSSKAGRFKTDSSISRMGNLSQDLRSRIDPESAGFSIEETRKRGLEASRGSTDFGEYFIYFSIFLVAAAMLLAALFFRLGIEQRVREIGTLQALGFPGGAIRHIFLLEGAILSFVGGLLGLPCALGYGGLLVFGLRTWWVEAVGTRHLSLYISPADLGLGASAGIVASLAVIAWTLRGLRHNSPRSLLAGDLEAHAIRRRRKRLLVITSTVTFLSAMLLLLGSAFRMIPDVEGFFGAGVLLLVSSLSLTALYLRRNHGGPITGHGWPAFLRLGARNAMYRPGRSLFCVALIASATFIIVSVEAFRRDPRSMSLDPASGTGGYALIASSALPIIHDPNSEAGREALGIPTSEFPDFGRIRFVPFRERPGDDASCLNLYAPQEPRILGAPSRFISDARFSFQGSLASSPEQKRNPWLLLESLPQDGAIPAIADANTIQYILHLAIGSELKVRGRKGAPVRLRLVAALRDSILQGALVISETSFLRAFPEREGYRFFLLNVPPAQAAQLAQSLSARLADWGFDAETSRARLAAYHRVEDTYLSTFQSLGGLGLMLGTAGLATVLLRNVLERRRELALLRAVGYRGEILSVIVVAENLVLMICGLSCGTVCALLAILPAIHSRGAPFPYAMVSLILMAVLVVGTASSIGAVIAAFRSPLLEALRSE